MPDSPPYCSIPAFFGKRFAAWCESKFSDDCHEHDYRYGSLHPKTGTRAAADRALRKAIAAKGYPILAFCVWGMGTVI